MMLYEIDPRNIFVLIMDKAELADLIKVVEWFATTEADLHLQPKWQKLWEDLLDVQKQEQLH